MPLSNEARNRIFIATTDKVIGNEISDAIDQGLAVHVPSWVGTLNQVAGGDLVTFSGGAMVVGAQGAGLYVVAMTATLSSNAGGQTIHAAVHIDGARTEILSGQTVQNAGDNKALGATGIVRLNVGDIVDLRVTSTGNHVDIYHAHLTMMRIAL